MLELFRVFALSNEFKLIPVRQDVSIIPLRIRVLIDLFIDVGKTGARQTSRAGSYPSQRERGRASRENQCSLTSVCIAAQIGGSVNIS